jgi:hypothetical protein
LFAIASAEVSQDITQTLAAKNQVMKNEATSAVLEVSPVILLQRKSFRPVSLNDGQAVVGSHWLIDGSVTPDVGVPPFCVNIS